MFPCEWVHFNRIQGYLVRRGNGNTFDFYETPQRATHTEKEDTASGDDFTAGAFEAPQRILRPGGLFRLVFPAHSPFCMNLSETQRLRQTQCSPLKSLDRINAPSFFSLILSCRAEDFSR